MRFVFPLIITSGVIGAAVMLTLVSMMAFIEAPDPSNSKEDRRIIYIVSALCGWFALSLAGMMPLLPRLFF